MNYAYWFANIPGLSNCAKISIHEKVGNAQDIYFLSVQSVKLLSLFSQKRNDLPFVFFILPATDVSFLLQT